MLIRIRKYKLLFQSYMWKSRTTLLQVDSNMNYSCTSNRSRKYFWNRIFPLLRICFLLTNVSQIIVVMRHVVLRFAGPLELDLDTPSPASISDISFQSTLAMTRCTSTLDGTFQCGPHARTMLRHHVRVVVTMVVQHTRVLLSATWATGTCRDAISCHTDKDWHSWSQVLCTEVNNFGWSCWQDLHAKSDKQTQTDQRTSITDKRNQWTFLSLSGISLANPAHKWPGRTHSPRDTRWNVLWYHLYLR